MYYIYAFLLMYTHSFCFQLNTYWDSFPRSHYYTNSYIPSTLMLILTQYSHFYSYSNTPVIWHILIFIYIHILELKHTQTCIYTHSCNHTLIHSFIRIHTHSLSCSYSHNFFYMHTYCHLFTPSGSFCYSYFHKNSHTHTARWKYVASRSRLIAGWCKNIVSDPYYMDLWAKI